MGGVSAMGRTFALVRWRGVCDLEATYPARGNGTDGIMGLHWDDLSYML